ncbi:nuclear segregation protein [Blastomyces gilchristii SLH14081]|uniref:Nuclear segregation protein n=1 Tax=Blastomyces gilchristii (strain SLH14081) TaxID=559298 RepID=A0A179UGN2_BLAGS|nr:nuclear segregation protein [Blastomyces gilchristii SLH14081]OAT06903.1 nuclear segregation protein [Blastomyces gilchristii SLH14081]
MAADTKAQAPSDGHKTRPENPSEEAYKANLARAENELASIQKRMEEIKAKINVAKPNNQDSPTAKRAQELRAELASIRQQQQGFKASRNSIQEKMNALEANIKSRVAEQKASRSRIAFKSVDEIDKEIQRLEKQVDSGTMKLVEERKNLAEISNLRKQRKGFSGFEESQKVIDDLKSQLSELKKSLDNPEAKALSDRYSTIQQELDAMKAEQDAAFKNLNALRDERTRIHGEQQKAYTAVREIKDNYYKARRAYKEYEDELYRIRRERQKAERESYEREKKKKIADKKLEEASRPAYTDEILTAQGLIRHFDPSYDFSTLGLEKDKKGRGGGYRAEVGRTVDASDLKGIKIIKKDDREENYFMGGTGGKKGKKGKKNSAASSPAPAQFNLSFGVIEDLASVKADPPMSQADVPALVAKLAEKITNWKAQQAAKTAENIKKAQEEIDRLDEEDTNAKEKQATDAARKPAIQSEGANGHVSAPVELKQEKDAVADAAGELQKASLEV